MEGGGYAHWNIWTHPDLISADNSLGKILIEDSILYTLLYGSCSMQGYSLYLRLQPSEQDVYQTD